jgi:hypothetical protein
MPLGVGSNDEPYSPAMRPQDARPKIHIFRACDRAKFLNYKMHYETLCKEVEGNSIDAFLAGLEIQFTQSNKRFKHVQSNLSAALEAKQVSIFKCSNLL